MACSCKKIKNIKVENANINLNESKKIKPFETCPYCASKHMSYALVKLNEDNDQLRYIGQVYLAYKHLEKYFINEAKLCFELITDFFQDKIYQDKIENVVNIIHNLAVNFNEEIKEGQNLNLEKDLKPFFRSALYIIAAGELYNFEVGYKDVNTPYVIGLLQRAAEEHIESIEKDDIRYESFQIKLRMLWKKIENNDDENNEVFNLRFNLNEKTFYVFAMKQIELQKHEIYENQK